MRERKCHRREALRCGVHNDHCVLLPGLASRLVANASPKVDDLLPVAVYAARSPEFVSAGEVLNESVPHGLKTRADGAANSSVSGSCHGRDLRRHWVSSHHRILSVVADRSFGGALSY